MSPVQENAILRALGRSVNSADRGDLEPAMAQALSRGNLEECLLGIAEALRFGRVILPILPHELNNQAECPRGQLPQVSLSAVTRALAVPVFSSLSTFEEAVKNGLATQMEPREDSSHPVRPMPVKGRALAIAALDSPGRILLDGRYLLPRPLLNALVCSDTWVPSWKNQHFLTLIAQLFAEKLPGSTWKIIPQEAAPDRLVVWVDPATPALAQSLNALQMGINDLYNLEAAADLIEVTPVPTGCTSDSNHQVYVR